MKKSISVLLVVVMVLALSATAFANEGPSHDNLPEPPVLENKVIEGTGTTANGDTYTVVSWDANDIPEDATFTDEKTAVEEALNSTAFKELEEKLGIDPEKLTGSSVVIIKFEGGSNEKAPVPVVLLYGDDGEPITGLYFYNGEWYELEVKVPEDGEEGEYTLVFGKDEDEDESGLVAEITVTITDKPDKVA